MTFIFKECEKKKKTHCLMGYFKNVLNLKNVIVENRASIVSKIHEYMVLIQIELAELLIGEVLIHSFILACVCVYL